MNASVICFGELLLRLAAPDRQQLLQSPLLEVHVGGAEANVAVSLAQFGHAVSMVSVVPDGPLGTSAIRALRSHGVDTTHVRRGRGRMGLYFLETGAMQRPSSVHYDRAWSAFANAPADVFDWNTLLQAGSRLHLSGVTPALGAASAAAAIAAARAAQALGVPVSFDGNYRAKLWEAWPGDAPALLRQIISEVDIAFADHRDVEIILGHVIDESSARARFAAAAQAAFKACPRLTRFASTYRVQHSVDHHVLSAFLATREGSLHEAPAYDLTAIVDRIGAGDAFAAGVLHGLQRGMTDADSLHFGLAAACLKHSIPGDFNLASSDDVTACMRHGAFDVRR